MLSSESCNAAIRGVIAHGLYSPGRCIKEGWFWCRLHTHHGSEALTSSIRLALYKTALLAAVQADGNLITKSFQNCALAMLRAARPGMALGYALAAIHTNPTTVLPKALYLSASACAALHFPQASKYFLDQVCGCATPCHVSNLPCAPHTF